MSYYNLPFAKTARYGSCTYEIEDLDLSDGGFPGLVFWGTLDIDAENDHEDWSISRATALNSKTGKYTIYDVGSNPAIFTAIVDAIYADKPLCVNIGAHSRDHY